MDVCFEGIIRFPSKPSASYRYKILRQGNCLQFWLEDRASKYQWESHLLGLSELPTFNARHFAASLEDYISIFQNYFLVPPCGISSDCTRDLLPNGDEHGADSLRLELTMKLRVLGVVWQSVFGFEMTPILVEPVQIAEAKLRDAEEELARLLETIKRKMMEREKMRIEMERMRPLVLESCGKFAVQRKGKCFLWQVRGTNNTSTRIALQACGELRCLFGGPVAIQLTIFHEAERAKSPVFQMRHLQADTTLKKDRTVENYGKVSLLKCEIVLDPQDKLVVWIFGSQDIRPDATLVLLPN